MLFFHPFFLFERSAMNNRWFLFFWDALIDEGRRGFYGTWLRRGRALFLFFSSRLHFFFAFCIYEVGSRDTGGGGWGRTTSRLVNSINETNPFYRRWKDIIIASALGE